MLHMLYLLLMELIFPAPPLDISEQQQSCAQQSYIVTQVGEISAQIEHAYKVDMIALNRVARGYKTSAFNDILEALQSIKLQELLCARQVEISQTYACAIDDLFDQARKQTKTNVRLEQRAALWIEFIQHCYTCQNHVRRQKLPNVWFAQNASHKNNELFVRNNQKLKIDASTQKYLMADSVLSYIPFALIEKHDPQALQMIMHAK